MAGAAPQLYSYYGVQNHVVSAEGYAAAAWALHGHALLLRVGTGRVLGARVPEQISGAEAGAAPKILQQGCWGRQGGAADAVVCVRHPLRSRARA